MKLRNLTLALGLAGLVTACDQVPLTPKDGVEQETTAAAAPAPSPRRHKDDSPLVATVNGTRITEAMVASYQQQRARRMGQHAQQPDRGAIMEEIISLELARQDGEDRGVDNSEQVVLQIDQQTRSVIAAAAIQSHLEKHPITDEELQKVYNEKVGSPGSEYKARHILVEDRETAAKLIGELDGGADFSELAKEHSTGPSGKNGGDLGWFSSSQMVAPFSEAVAKLEKGSYTKEPVETQFGWHVIILDDSRDITPPPFEQVKPQLQAFVQNQRVQDYVGKLKREATIVMAEPAPAAGGTDEGTADEGGQDAGEEASPPTE